MNRCWHIFVCLLFFQESTSQITYETVFVDYDSAWQFKNLKIIPIRAKGRGMLGGAEIISLHQGLKTGMITISERGTASTENVHWLRLTNKTNNPVFVGSGEILIGGRQDRMVTKDTLLLPAGKDQYIPVMCVEEGRWSQKEKRFVYGNYANPRLRKVLDQSKNQVRIWKEISNQLDSNKITSSTLAYAAPHPDKKMVLYKEEYFGYFSEKFQKADSTIVGVVCISDMKVIGSDIFAGTNLFYNALDPLLHGYIEEAIRFGKIPAVPDSLVKKYMDQFMINEKSQEQYLKKNGKIYKYGGRVFHVTAY
ncbi:MAG: ARPP-1 family domain-containing protein [Flavisolibacter sp.]